MKTILFMSLLLAGLTLKSQVVTTTLSVKGNCEECKSRIENAGDIKGVKLLEWDPDTKVAKVIYNSSKTSLENIEKAIAKKGYETPTQKADEAAYNKLPDCCKYRSGKGDCTDKK